MKIRLFKPSLGDEELQNIKEVFERAWLGLGPKVAEFEMEWSKYLGIKASIAVNSATAALHLALTAYHFKEGCKVLIPIITFASTATAILYNKLEPVFVDIDENTITMSLDDLDKKYTKDCVAIIPVHMGGQPVLMDILMEFAREKKLAVIEDCAHCAGGEFKGKMLGKWGHIGCFSFEEKKCMTTGDGGMICSEDEHLIQPLREYRWIGIDKDTWKRASKYTDSVNIDARHWYYEIAVLGYKYNMNDLAAAIGLAQLKKLDSMNLKRSHCIKRYLQGIQNCKHITPLLPYDPDKYVYWIFGIRCKMRDPLIIYLKSKGIATGMHYMPLPLHPLLKPYYKVPCDTGMKIWESFITLPLFADLTETEIDYIIEALIAFDAKY
ncbi:MAG: UDP-4-amino-4-deoxy-L-arabinose-oxoglutarate aminotransferase [Candidatus Fischerbacteria bacterium RBG_13_37_8]|uniref:UDP-4-amino-4-deoxy-L-arabinose-oxoglutarate aminotransferase n=1 Tax=Candidatus Fischerbacteria bacterium RBG_13_37_8 TaxID=1817863 RepID=A0A1F5VNQ0_9BACT|nr:MAG: UDP-4-amino-4-deoxy-L-arabinose-oxoglutarate aminotransferase [Candidatus Fischerbacteria bacterium RBG_13_37_8]